MTTGQVADQLALLVEQLVGSAGLDLAGLNVLTEAATGPYAVTPVIAALAGASVTAVTAASRHGSVDQVRDETYAIAQLLGVADLITITTDKTPELFGWADIVTNSGHVRPISASFASAIRPGSAVPLMFETWEIQAGRDDLDLDLLAAGGVLVAGTNERHPHVGVFDCLGPMAVAQLHDSGLDVAGKSIAVLCDNPFQDYVLEGLAAAGAQVWCSDSLGELLRGRTPDVLLVSLKPTGSPVITNHLLEILASAWSSTLICQFWGDIDRAACDRWGLQYWPPRDPGPGHMGVLPSRLGPEPIIRLQVGGFKVAQVLLTPAARRTPEMMEWLYA